MPPRRRTDVIDLTGDSPSPPRRRRRQPDVIDLTHLPDSPRRGARWTDLPLDMQAAVASHMNRDSLGRFAATSRGARNIARPVRAARDNIAAWDAYRATRRHLASDRLRIMAKVYGLALDFARLAYMDRARAEAAYRAMVTKYRLQPSFSTGMVKKHVGLIEHGPTVRGRLSARAAAQQHPKHRLTITLAEAKVTRLVRFGGEEPTGHTYYWLYVTDDDFVDGAGYANPGWRMSLRARRSDLQPPPNLDVATIGTGMRPRAHTRRQLGRADRDDILHALRAALDVVARERGVNRPRIRLDPGARLEGNDLFV